jgi:hypothetical protein
MAVPRASAALGGTLLACRLFFFVLHPDADCQADDDGADDNNQENEVLHGFPPRLRLSGVWCIPGWNGIEVKKDS